MRVIYLILTTTGWAWLAVAFAAIWLRMRHLRRRHAAAATDATQDDKKH